MKKTESKGSSIYKGVSWRKEAQCWQAKIHLDGAQKHLGYFDTEKEASDAYQAEAMPRDALKLLARQIKKKIRTLHLELETDKKVGRYAVEKDLSMKAMLEFIVKDWLIDREIETMN